MREEKFWCKNPRYSEVRVITRRVIARFDCIFRNNFRVISTHGNYKGSIDITANSTDWFPVIDIFVDHASFRTQENIFFNMFYTSQLAFSDLTLKTLVKLAILINLNCELVC